MLRPDPDKAKQGQFTCTFAENVQSIAQTPVPGRRLMSTERIGVVPFLFFPIGARGRGTEAHNVKCTTMAEYTVLGPATVSNVILHFWRALVASSHCQLKSKGDWPLGKRTRKLWSKTRQSGTTACTHHIIPGERLSFNLFLLLER